MSVTGTKKKPSAPSSIISKSTIIDGGSIQQTVTRLLPCMSKNGGKEGKSLNWVSTILWQDQSRKKPEDGMTGAYILVIDRQMTQSSIRVCPWDTTDEVLPAFVQIYPYQACISSTHPKAWLHPRQFHAHGLHTGGN